MLLNAEFSRPVQAPYGVHVLSLKKKDRSPQQRMDRRIQSKLTIRCKYPLPMLTRRVDRPRGAKYLSKSNIRPRYCRINALSHVRECHQGGLLREEDTQWSDNLECQAIFNGLKQAMIKGLSLGVVDTTKTPKVEAEQFSCVLEEYLHHCVDGRQKNWVQLLKVAQFGHGAQTNSLIKRSPFEIKGKRHSVSPPLADGPNVGDNPQDHRVEEERGQIADIARVCLEEASRPMVEGVDRERCPLELEWMTKLPINGTTTPYDYLSTWTWRETEKSRKSLQTE
ncbi:taxadiene 5-alpha hydroxylase [Cucumis melo var. makuwa]|uniref:Taxadiene 5-alpha hydroxylase n=1 Tax=Cucumis melo var. makuwa TaxID=1194695 RepID=A0A5A7UYF9_CUCMM|nr:taxadiene 5-alpha hydroxylase [Cucumis melo var. makuwa]